MTTRAGADNGYAHGAETLSEAFLLGIEAQYGINAVYFKIE